MKTSYLIKSSTPTKLNKSRCWFNIRCEALESAAENGKRFYIVCDIDGEKYLYSESADKLLAVFTSAEISIIRKQPFRYSFFVDYKKGDIYKTVSVYNDEVILSLQRETSYPQGELPTESLTDCPVEEEYYWATQGVSPISNKNLSSKGVESYNYHHLAAILAEYGYESYRINDDSHGADLIAYHLPLKNTDKKFSLVFSVLKIQLKSRVTIAKKYTGKDIITAFPKPNVENNLNEWYLIPHDELLKLLISQQETPTWQKKGEYSTNYISKKLHEQLKPYIIKSGNIRD